MRLPRLQLLPLIRPPVSLACQSVNAWLPMTMTRLGRERRTARASGSTMLRAEESVR